jgi:predicted N-acetyltransferase YhbS
MLFSIRPETPKDYRETEILTKKAFWDVYTPGCDEHLILHKLRQVQAFIPELDFVAEFDLQIIGNIVYSRTNFNGIIAMGPLSVLPKFQNRGVGSALVKHTVNVAKFLKYQAIIIYGNPKYYSRFGFKNAVQYNLHTPTGENRNSFMVLETYTNSLHGIQGNIIEDPVFQTNPQELSEFEKNFPTDK